MPEKTIYFVTLKLDEQWFQAVDNLISDVYDGEVCEVISIDVETEGTDGE